MAQAETPGPIPNRKLRTPATAMVLHPYRCGECTPPPHHTNYGSPLQHLRPKGAFRPGEYPYDPNSTHPLKTPGFSLTRPTSGTIPGRPRRQGASKRDGCAARSHFRRKSENSTPP